MVAPDLSSAHRLVLIRHGATAHTVEQRFSGAGFVPEPGLSPLGFAQAEAVGQRLAELFAPGDIDDILTSPLLRARQTAAVIAERLRVPEAVVDPAWVEAHFGEWEGRTAQEVEELAPGGLQRVWQDPAAAPPGGESRLQVQERVERRWAGLARPGRITLVVTHLTPIRAVVAMALRTASESFGAVIVEPGSISVVDRWRDGGAVVMVLGERPVGLRPR